MTSECLMQIGEVADRTALSLRTIRYYEEVGLVVPTERSRGGFRLYSSADVKRLWLIRRLKPLDLSLDQIKELLETMDRSEPGRELADEEAAALQSTLAAFLTIARSRCQSLRDQLAGAEEFAADLTTRIGEFDHPVGSMSQRR